MTTTTPPWGFRAWPTKRHDGDSFWVMADCGFDIRAEPELRLLDVHAPELQVMRLPRMMQPGGQETTDFVNYWLDHAGESSRRFCLWVETVMTRTFEPTQSRTFTRYVATVWPFDRRGPEDSLNYAVALFLSGHPEWPSGN